jgi:hypothetical protein
MAIKSYKAQQLLKQEREENARIYQDEKPVHVREVEEWLARGW